MSRYPEAALKRLRETPGNPYYGASDEVARRLYDEWDRDAGYVAPASPRAAK